MAYGTGKDTRDYFGDGRFQIIEIWKRRPGAEGPPYIPSLVLYDLKKTESITDDVANWTNSADHVYVLTNKGEYFILNISTGTSEKFASMALVPDVHRKACESIGYNAGLAALILIIAIPVIANAAIRRKLYAFLVSAPLCVFVLWTTMIFAEARSPDSDFDIIFGFACLAWAVVVVAGCGLLSALFAICASALRHRSARGFGQTS